MRVSQHIWRDGVMEPALPDDTPQLVLLFGNQAAREVLAELQQRFPDTPLAGCSTSGQIAKRGVCDGVATITLMYFSDTRIQMFSAEIHDAQDSQTQASELALQAQQADLQHLMILADGLSIDAQAAVQGISQTLAPFNNISGGVAGDNERYQQTFTYHQQGTSSKRIILIGFYGDKLQVNYGCYGGWKAFGPMRYVTRSEGNRLYELDGQSALALYEQYLGEHAKNLPASGQRFPLGVRYHEQDTDQVVCTVFGIDRDDDCLIFALNIPEGAITQLMHASIDSLIDGAQVASEQACGDCDSQCPEFALLVSCIGRRSVLQQIADEEIEVLSETLCSDIPHSGFYSYGEIAPIMGTGPCSLHNQTMTVTTFSELK